MCGRFTLSTPPAVIAERYHFADGPAVAPRYNIAPGQPVAVVRPAAGAKEGTGPRELALVTWGLVPAWAADDRGGFINARSETAADKPAFRAAFRARRCLVPADGYFEWAAEGGRKQPYYFRRADRAPFAFAGLWESRVGPDGRPRETCAILTAAANALSRPVHDRVPVILSGDAADEWLDPRGTNARRLAALLAPWDPAGFVCHPVGRAVNRVASEGPALVEPVAAARTLWDAV